MIAGEPRIYVWPMGEGESLRESEQYHWEPLGQRVLLHVSCESGPSAEFLFAPGRYQVQLLPEISPAAGLLAGVLLFALLARSRAAR